MRVLITGANGMLGSELVNYLDGYAISGFSRKELDVTNRDNVRDVFSQVKPDVVIHTAAHTNVDDAEHNPDEAYKINTLGTQNIVDHCLSTNILLIYISSTGIYGDHEKRRYSEFDRIDPTTIHHKTKYEAERIVKSHLNRFLILRVGWLYGGEEGRKNFVLNRYREALSSKVISSDNTQMGNPTWVREVVRQVSALIDSKISGVYNCVNTAKNVTRMDYVEKIVNLFDLSVKVLPADAKKFKRKALVSKNESANNYKLDLLGMNVMRNWDIALEEYISEVRKKQIC